ncbi:MAG: polysaccharide biosynthesis protein, partial [Dehalococcoidia bacterium]|nr:polysaccharide biosynthesis protein [Dehalococcoidia bacterium]
KRILVTGGTGSIGSEIVRKVLQHEPKVVRIFSNGEEGLFYLQQELRDYSNTRYLVGDVRDIKRLRMAMENIDIVFHTAALKHVHACEYNPFEAIKTNVLGTQNVIEVAFDEEVSSVVNISTDKACNPASTLGVTKLLAERLITNTNFYRGFKKTIFSSVRFGNVLDSRGSVVPLFRKQIQDGGPVTITHPDMTRFIMSLPGAVELVLKVAEIAKGGEIFFLKMPTLRIIDLGQVMIEELAPKYGYKPEDIKIETIGKRAGEKLHEELMTEEESLRAEETEEMYIVHSPSVTPELAGGSHTPVKKPKSKVPKLLTREEVRALIREIAI